jgi:four helix bundle protein
MMNEGQDNLVVDKSYNFSLMIIELYKFLIHNKKEYILSKQLLRSGTSIGANINEAQAAISKKDFIAKVSISSKEARESKYWLMLLKDSGYIDPSKKKVKILFEEIDSLINITTKIVKSSQENEK